MYNFNNTIAFHAGPKSPAKGVQLQFTAELRRIRRPVSKLASLLICRTVLTEYATNAGSKK